MTDGTVGWNPGKMNPMIIKPAGPIDPDVSVLYAADSGRQTCFNICEFCPSS